MSTIWTSSLINIYVKTAYQNGWLAVFCVEPLTAVGVRSIAARVAKPDKRTLAVQTISSVRFNSFTYVHGIEENNADKKEKTEKNTVTLRHRNFAWLSWMDSNKCHGVVSVLYTCMYVIKLLKVFNFIGKVFWFFFKYIVVALYKHNEYFVQFFLLNFLWLIHLCDIYDSCKHVKFL